MQCIIIGAGVSGLACAVDLADRGHKVTVLEATDNYGGKINEFSAQGYRFDMGPSLFTAPELLTSLLGITDADSGSNPFLYERVDPVCNYFFPDGNQWKAPADPEQFIREFATAFDEPMPVVRRYVYDLHHLYTVTAPVFIFKSLHKLKSYFSRETIRGLLNFHKLRVFKSLHRFNNETFKNPNSVMFFNRFATYNGSNPYKAPATLRVIPNLEIYGGAWFPAGGMRSIVDAIYQKALQLGVTFEFHTPVSVINSANGRIQGVETANGKKLEAPIVVSAVDARLTWKMLPNANIPGKIEKAENSSSAIVFFWGVKKQFSEFSLHNIIFSADYEKEFRHIFEQHDICSDPTIYINITARYCADDAPEGHDNYFVMINTPADFDQNWDILAAKAREAVIKRISGIINADFESFIEFEKVMTPRDIAHNTGSNRGSIYGTSSNSLMSAFNRQANFTSEFKGLYFCGGSVHPGGGIPLCIAGARITGQLIGNP